MSLVRDIWASWRRLPLWVQVWVALVLVPVNAASVLFLGTPGGLVLAALAVGAMLMNLAIMVHERGLSRAMALPHLVLWIPLAAYVLWLLRVFPGMPAGFRSYLWLLLAVDVISLVLDLRDGWKWLRGDRDVA